MTEADPCSILLPDEGPVAQLFRADGQAPVLLVCEHASAFIPSSLNDLGLATADRYSHAVWDIGAADLAMALADTLDSPLVMSGVSRLVYDCNRPPEVPDAIPAKSEVIEVPANRDLTPAARAARAAAVYEPFSARLFSLLDQAGPRTALVTIHSFTPVYFGKDRPTEIGILHDRDDRLALALATALEGCGLRVELNQPYSAKDGVTHTLARHAIPRGLPNVMIEVRNDFLRDPAGIARIAAILAPALDAAIGGLAQNRSGRQDSGA